MQLEAEVREDSKRVAGWLLYYHERKKDFEYQREEILHSTARPGVNGGVTNAISDITGSKGGKLGDLKEAEDWLKLIDELEKRLPWKMQILLRLKQRHRIGVRGRPVRWMIALELSEEVSQKIKKDYSVGPDTIDEWWGRVVNYAVVMAAKRGLLG